MNTRSSILALTFSALAAAHPMGNFSVSHYARLDVAADGVDVRYVLDLAEIPTYQLLRSWNLDARSPKADLDRRAADQAREWVRNLEFASGGHRLTPRVEGVDLVLADGAGNVPIARITTRLHLKAAPGSLSYEDRNYPDRAGWKEIVIASGKGAVIRKASQSEADQSRALTQYPSDPTVAPPQDLRAAVEWVAEPITAAAPVTRRPPVLVPVDQPQAPIGAPAPAPPPSSINAAAAAPGTVVRGDYLSRMLGNRDLTWAMLLAGLIVAFALGAAHALEPGHGKTIVAAYLVGSRGTIRHALFLGGMVTFTHTISVFLLGFVTLFLSKYVVPERLFPVLGAISGLSIVAIGGSLLFKRVRTLNAAQAHHHHHDHPHDHPHDHHHEVVPAHTHAHDAHDHHHDHPHDHVHDHPHAHDHVHDHAHDPVHDHPHDHGHDHGHSHMPEGDITLGSLIALGASGGLVPCPSALVILLSAIALGRVVLGLALLVSFSLGLALVLMAIGVMVLYAKNLLPDTGGSRHAAFRLVPVLSAAVIVCLGLLMTVVSLGWVHPGRFIG